LRPGRAADHSPLLAPWLLKSRAIPLPTLWATTGPVTGTVYLHFHISTVRNMCALSNMTVFCSSLTF